MAKALKMASVGPVMVTIRSGQFPSEMLILAPLCKKEGQPWSSHSQENWGMCWRHSSFFGLYPACLGKAQHATVETQRAPGAHCSLGPWSPPEDIPSNLRKSSPCPDTVLPALPHPDPQKGLLSTHLGSFTATQTHTIKVSLACGIAACKKRSAAYRPGDSLVAKGTKTLDKLHLTRDYISLFHG